MDLTRLHRRCSVQRFHRYPSKASNIVARAFKFPGYLQSQNILSGNFLELILKNEMAAIADFLLLSSFFLLLWHCYSQIFSTASLVLGVVIGQFWSLCSDWLCLWSHSRLLEKCLQLVQYCFQRFAMINWIIVLAFKDFLADLEKQHGRHSSFSYLYSSFSSYSYCGCVIATVFKLSREIRY